MVDKEIPRSIRFPESLWNAIDRDAKRCRRSSVKQLEAVLTRYYELDNVDLNEKVVRKVQNENQPRVELIERDDLGEIIEALQNVEPLTEVKATKNNKRVS